MANYTTVYYYEFGYQGNASNSNRTYEGLYRYIINTKALKFLSVGAGHAEEVFYLFYFDSLNYTETDLQVANTIVSLWSNFAKFG